MKFLDPDKIQKDQPNKKKSISPVLAISPKRTFEVEDAFNLYKNEDSVNFVTIIKTNFQKKFPKKNINTS